MIPSLLLLLLLLSTFLCLLPGMFSSGVVTLQSIEIYTTHELLSTTPTVYFQCRGENKTILPDVKKKTFLYIFKGEESWQPLTELSDAKCKRCGFYEKDTLKFDDVYDEWEFCPSDFKSGDGKVVHFKENELNATFVCPLCKGSSHPPTATKENKTNVALVIIASSLLSTVLIVGAVGAYKYWRKRRREQEQARFLKLFEDGDDIEDELGVDHM